MYNIKRGTIDYFEDPINWMDNLGHIGYIIYAKNCVTGEMTSDS